MTDALAAMSLAQRRYSSVAIAFHWTIAALIFVNLAIGFLHEYFDKATTTRLMILHMAIGLTVLGLTVLRLLWRLIHRPPAFEEVLRPWEAVLARTTHWLFYGLLLILPLSGWLLPSSRGYPVGYFGLFTISPLPVARTDEFHEFAEGLHELFALAMLGLILLHVAGAAKHHFQGHSQVLRRMVPFLGRSA